MFNVSPEAWSFLFAMLGVGSAFTLALKRTWSNRDRADQAYIKAREDAKAETDQALDQLRKDMDDRFRERDDWYTATLETLNEDIQRLRWAIVHLIPLVAPSKMDEALKILVELNLGGIKIDVTEAKGDKP